MPELKIIDYLITVLFLIGGYLWNGLRQSVVLLFGKYDALNKLLTDEYYTKAEVDKPVEDAVKIAKLEIERDLGKSSR